MHERYYEKGKTRNSTQINLTRISRKYRTDSRMIFVQVHKEEVATELLLGWIVATYCVVGEDTIPKNLQ